MKKHESDPPQEKDIQIETDPRWFGCQTEQTKIFKQLL